MQDVKTYKNEVEFARDWEQKKSSYEIFKMLTFCNTLIVVYKAIQPIGESKALIPAG